MLRRIWRENSLSIVLFAVFALVFVGQVLTGHAEYNDERKEMGKSALPVLTYLTSGHFVEATFENWESEFLQMAAYVLLTIWLRQKGSPDSKKLDEEEPFDKPSKKTESFSPIAKFLYENSLSLALLMLFVISFGLHAAGGTVSYNEEQVAQGKERRGSGSSRFRTGKANFFRSECLWC